MRLPSLHYIHPERWSWCKVGERPTAFLMDTPGVMLPNVPNEQTGMRLALTGMTSVNYAVIQHCPVDEDLLISVSALMSVHHRCLLDLI